MKSDTDRNPAELSKGHRDYILTASGATAVGVPRIGVPYKIILLRWFLDEMVWT